LNESLPGAPSPRPDPSPWRASLLSFIFPGAGQFYAGQRRAAAIFAVPVLLLVAFVLAQLPGGIDTFAAQLIAPSFALITLAVIIVLGIWRLASIGHAFRLAPAAARRQRSAIATLVAVVVGVAVVHGAAGYYTYAFYDAGSQIFQVQESPQPTSSDAGSPSPFSSDGGLETPATTLPPPTNRVTFLLTGVDSGHNRDHALTDTLLVASLNKDTNQAVMLSIPRDTAQFPMYSGGTYSGKINSLLSAAYGNRAAYPDGPTGTLIREIGFLIGIPINYYANINLEGFQSLVDLVGGVDVVNPKWILDSQYDWFNGTYGFTLSPGPHHLDGAHALAYARSRYGVGDNDFTRAARQQQLLVSLRAKMGTATMLAKLPSILQVAGRTISTNFPSDQIRDYLILAKQVDTKNIQQFVLGPPYSVSPPENTTGGTYILRMDFSKVAALSIQLFGRDSAYASGIAGAAPWFSPLPSPSPTP
jgi:polyisoprenyl-teichoic acid--peptidoglycan teichoic acid transferase